MEFISTKRSRKRKRKRRFISNKLERRDQIKIEVRSRKRQTIATALNFSIKKEKFVDNMEASAFWENYKAAHEWQKRHNVTWWKTRCFALEHENHVLKETIRNLTNNQNYSHNLVGSSQIHQQDEAANEELNDGNENNADDNLEFQLNEDMMNFLAQSIRHKIELKNKKESEEAAEQSEKSDEEPIKHGLAWIRKRNDCAKLLYGEASARVLAMETALQTTIERHIDKAKPQYWPNIPLKL
ncbi:uncharacterized protein F10E9.5 [Nasonia vitripennis]|uniref:Gem-associated protein 8 n=1 Tax=Nasonia vitripennis TaxID=7425 RepID=A0A7M7GGZ1_NASVI|nr:uncharacterized protein F10E9.5 [Nasonia vitripennis]